MLGPSKTNHQHHQPACQQATPHVTAAVLTGDGDDSTCGVNVEVPRCRPTLWCCPSRPNSRCRRSTCRQQFPQASAIPCTETEDSTAEADFESQPPPPSDPLFCVNQQVTCKGNSGREQKEENWLKHSWTHLWIIEEDPVQLHQPLPVAYFLICNSMLYYHCDHHGEPQDLLIVPCTKVESVLHVAHTQQLGGHLGH